MNLFNINYPILLNYLLPVRKRTVIRKTWLNVLIAPVIYLYNLFKLNRDSNLYYLTHTGQVIYLQAALNDTFDNTLRRILIADPAYIDPLWTYIDAENKPVWFYTDSESSSACLFTDAEILGSWSGFLIQIPTALSLDASRMNAVIDKYRLVGKNTYIIQTI